jgi:hypothetical protein
VEKLSHHIEKTKIETQNLTNIGFCQILFPFPEMRNGGFFDNKNTTPRSSFHKNIAAACRKEREGAEATEAGRDRDREADTETEE